MNLCLNRIEIPLQYDAHQGPKHSTHADINNLIEFILFILSLCFTVTSVG